MLMEGMKLEIKTPAEQRGAIVGAEGDMRLVGRSEEKRYLHIGEGRAVAFQPALLEHRGRNREGHKGSEHLLRNESVSSSTSNAPGGRDTTGPLFTIITSPSHMNGNELAGATARELPSTSRRPALFTVWLAS